MTQKEEIIRVFRNHNYRMTLGVILCYPWGYKFTSRASELRKEGYVVLCEKAKHPSDNLYRIIPPAKNGQIQFA
jgi:hypothetical protein